MAELDFNSPDYARQRLIQMLSDASGELALQVSALRRTPEQTEFLSTELSFKTGMDAGGVAKAVADCQATLRKAFPEVDAYFKTIPT